jgi:hypothetical protein
MVPLVYQSDQIPYGLPGQYGLVASTSLFPPPKIYAESFASICGLFVANEPTENSDSVVTLLAYMRSQPFAMRWFKMDSTTGKFVSRSVGITVSIDAFWGVWQMRDGSLWGSPANAGSVYELDPVTLKKAGDPLINVFGIQEPLVDKATNLVVQRALGSSSRIAVQTLSTGVVIREIALSGSIQSIVAEDDTRCFVVTSREIVHLVDYVQGRVLSTFRIPLLDAGVITTLPPGAKEYVYAFDRRLRRFLVLSWRPDAVDGACTTFIRGYHPVPIATAVTKAIPLQPPRANRTVRCLARVSGDVGEGVAGARVTATVTGGAALVGTPQAADTNGDSLFSVRCNAAGSADINLSVEV